MPTTPPATPTDRRETESAGPLYLRIQDVVRDGIANATLKPGDRLPSESELAQRYSTTRATVARALRELALAGLIRREAGRGSFVSHPPVRAPFVPTLSESFEDAVRDTHGAITYRVVSVGRVPASEEVAAGLGLPVGTEVLRLERLRSVRNMPISLVTRYLPVEIGRRISADAISRYSIHHMLAEEVGRPILHTEGYVRAGNCEADAAKLLDVRRGAPVLMRVYTMSGADRTPLVYGISLYRAEFHVAYNRLIQAP